VKAKRIHFVLVRLLFVVFVLSASASNSRPAARLTGVVVDQTGAVIPGTSVTLLSTDRAREAKTDERGQFEFANLPPGLFDLKAEHLGFKVRAIENIRVEADLDQYLSVTLDVASVGSCNDVGEPKINYEMRTGTVNLIGDIADLWDGPLEGSTVTITNLKSRKTLVVSTAKNGQFQTADLEPGKYSLKASHDGYEELSKFTFWVTDNNLTRLGPVYIVKKYESRVWLCL